MTRTMVRTVKGKSVKPGDYYMYGLINGHTHGECFTVERVEQIAHSEFYRLHGAGGERVTVTASDDVLVERTYA